MSLNIQITSQGLTEQERKLQQAYDYLIDQDEIKKKRLEKERDELKKQKTPELEKIIVLIEEILESRSDKSAEIAVGDKVSFEIRKNCVIEGEVLSKTDKRVKVHTTKISGVYQIASKKVDILASAPPADTEEE